MSKKNTTDLIRLKISVSSQLNKTDIAFSNSVLLL